MREYLIDFQGARKGDVVPNSQAPQDIRERGNGCEAVMLKHVLRLGMVQGFF